MLFEIGILQQKISNLSAHCGLNTVYPNQIGPIKFPITNIYKPL